MSLTQDRGDYVIECDGARCHETIETGTGNFDSARNMLHRQRWVARKQGDEWRHFCPGCQEGGR